MKKPELLAPAGSFEKAKVAFMYGADAVYCGTASLSICTQHWKKSVCSTKYLCMGHKL